MIFHLDKELEKNIRAISSVGSEHPDFIGRVGKRNTSSPSLPTRFHLDKELEKNIRAISSVGSEHLVYTEGVGGSNPSLPTKTLSLIRWSFFCFYGYDLYCLHFN